MKAEYLHITVATGVLFASRVAYYILQLLSGPFWKQSTYALQWLLGALLKGENLFITSAVGSLLESRVFTYDQLSEYTIWVDGKFLPKLKKMYARKISRGATEKGAPEASASRSSPQTHHCI